MKKSDQINELAMALAKFQGSMPQVIKNKTVKIPNRPVYSYADLTGIWECIRKPLSSVGLSVTQVFNENMITTILLHSSGQWIESDLTLKGIGGKAQDLGSEITYMKRYALSSILGITSEEDDDGESAQNAEPKKNSQKPDTSTSQSTITASQSLELITMLKQCSQDFKTNFWDLMKKEVPGIQALEQLPIQLYPVFKNKILANKRSQEMKEVAYA